MSVTKYGVRNKSKRKKTYLIGDVHGKFSEYKKICDELDSLGECQTIQIGDMGIGFPGNTDDLGVGKNHLFFRGNHDNPQVCRAHPRYLHDFGMYGDMFVVAGAASIDKVWRIQQEMMGGHKCWWFDEELDIQDREDCYKLYKEAKPEIVISHEAPFFLHNLLATGSVLNNPGAAQWGEPKGNETAFLLDRMYQVHQPRVHIFGHWHESLKFCHLKTQFICLNELEVLDLDDILG